MSMLQERGVLHQEPDRRQELIALLEARFNRCHDLRSFLDTYLPDSIQSRIPEKDTLIGQIHSTIQPLEKRNELSSLLFALLHEFPSCKYEILALAAKYDIIVVSHHTLSSADAATSANVAPIPQAANLINLALSICVLSIFALGPNIGYPLDRWQTDMITYLIVPLTAFHLSRIRGTAPQRISISLQFFIIFFSAIFWLTNSPGHTSAYMTLTFPTLFKTISCLISMQIFISAYNLGANENA